ncbi:hypothetical protein OF117_11220 [Geodermatophilus sp. YIM 151500]|uniref:hypothetical protein n=1 Tax=Geodermatophilus sp. YIM 151500 TaxID=2984531 RepID=UPI0021E446FC|nr:hypothetical protein [Geodermatophilus sp. YIM 151500]MCV2489934.1 hypothetical protein [Geodermatophilus sp. YIM 151500]
MTTPLLLGVNNTAPGGTVTRLIGSTSVGAAFEASNSSVGGLTGGAGIQASGGSNGVVAFGGSLGVQAFANGGASRSFGIGVRGTGSSLSGVGVEGIATGLSAPGGSAGIGVRGMGNRIAVDGVGVSGQAHTGVAGAGRWGVHGVSRAQDGADASDFGVMGFAQQLNGNGVIGQADSGFLAYGVWGRSSTGFAGNFDGNVRIFGNLTKTGTNMFQIDHPLDPENMYLRHASVESPEVLNVYSGNVETDGDGKASVGLPDYFEVLNRDARYQLTVIGEPAVAVVSREVRDNQFEIRTDRPGVKVSWQVTGVRNDAFMQRNPLAAEEQKSPEDRGTYLAPEAFGQPASRGVEYALIQQLEARLAESSTGQTPPQ